MLKIETRIIDARVGRDFPSPAYATTGSAGMDLRACLDTPQLIAPGEVANVGTGIAISIGNPGYMALLAPRSGLGVKHGIVLANTIGIIDSDYQNEIRVVLFNRGTDNYNLHPGERMAQLIIMPVARADLKIISDFSQTTERDGGFGSTGRF
jgi:dUTP pyrophosphatase